MGGYNVGSDFSRTLGGIQSGVEVLQRREALDHARRVNEESYRHTTGTSPHIGEGTFLRVSSGAVVSIYVVSTGFVEDFGTGIIDVVIRRRVRDDVTGEIVDGPEVYSVQALQFDSVGFGTRRASAPGSAIGVYPEQYGGAFIAPEANGGSFSVRLRYRTAGGIARFTDTRMIVWTV